MKNNSLSSNNKFIIKIWTVLFSLEKMSFFQFSQKTRDIKMQRILNCNENNFLLIHNKFIIQLRTISINLEKLSFTIFCKNLFRYQNETNSLKNNSLLILNKFISTLRTVSFSVKKKSHSLFFRKHFFRYRNIARILICVKNNFLFIHNKYKIQLFR